MEKIVGFFAENNTIIKREMNSLKVNEMVYKIQDLIIKKELLTFEKFKNIVYKIGKINKENDFFSKELEKIFAFIESIQNYQNIGLLVQALKTMFKMFLKDITTPGEYVHVYFERKNTLFKNMKLNNIPLHLLKRMKQKDRNFFIIPKYKLKNPQRNYKKEYYKMLNDRRCINEPQIFFPDSLLKEINKNFVRKNIKMNEFVQERGSDYLGCGIYLDEKNKIITWGRKSLLSIYY